MDRFDAVLSRLKYKAPKAESVPDTPRALLSSSLGGSFIAEDEPTFSQEDNQQFMDQVTQLAEAYQKPPDAPVGAAEPAPGPTRAPEFKSIPGVQRPEHMNKPIVENYPAKPAAKQELPSVPRLASASSGKTFAQQKREEFHREAQTAPASHTSPPKERSRAAALATMRAQSLKAKPQSEPEASDSNHATDSSMDGSSGVQGRARRHRLKVGLEIQVNDVQKKLSEMTKHYETKKRLTQEKALLTPGLPTMSGAGKPAFPPPSTLQNGPHKRKREDEDDQRDAKRRKANGQASEEPEPDPNDSEDSASWLVNSDDDEENGGDDAAGKPAEAAAEAEAEAEASASGSDGEGERKASAAAQAAREQAEREAREREEQARVKAQEARHEADRRAAEARKAAEEKRRREEAEKREAEKREAEKREAEKREVEKKEAERRTREEQDRVRREREEQEREERERELREQQRARDEEEAAAARGREEDTGREAMARQEEQRISAVDADVEALAQAADATDAAQVAQTDAADGGWDGVEGFARRKDGGAASPLDRSGDLSGPGWDLDGLGLDMSDTHETTDQPAVDVEALLGVSPGAEFGHPMDTSGLGAGAPVETTAPATDLAAQHAAEQQHAPVADAGAGGWAVVREAHAPDDKADADVAAMDLETATPRGSERERERPRSRGGAPTPRAGGDGEKDDTVRRTPRSRDDRPRSPRAREGRREPESGRRRDDRDERDRRDDRDDRDRRDRRDRRDEGRREDRRDDRRDERRDDRRDERRGRDDRDRGDRRDDRRDRDEKGRRDDRRDGDRRDDDAEERQRPPSERRRDDEGRGSRGNNQRRDERRRDGDDAPDADAGKSGTPRRQETPRRGDGAGTQRSPDRTERGGRSDVQRAGGPDAAAPQSRRDANGDAGSGDKRRDASAPKAAGAAARDVGRVKAKAPVTSPVAPNPAPRAKGALARTRSAGEADMDVDSPHREKSSSVATPADAEVAVAAPSNGPAEKKIVYQCSNPLFNREFNAGNNFRRKGMEKMKTDPKLGTNYVFLGSCKLFDCAAMLEHDFKQRRNKEKDADPNHAIRLYNHTHDLFQHLTKTSPFPLSDACKGLCHQGAAMAKYRAYSLRKPVTLRNMDVLLDFWKKAKPGEAVTVPSEKRDMSIRVLEESHMLSMALLTWERGRAEAKEHSVAGDLTSCTPQEFPVSMRQSWDTAMKGTGMDGSTPSPAAPGQSPATTISGSQPRS